MSKFVLDCGDLPFAALEDALAEVAESDAILAAEVRLVDEKEIQTLNRTFRNCDRVTDVLSFPSMEGIKGKFLSASEHPFECDEDGRLFLGSVAVCTSRAREQAEEYGHSYERELYYLVVHGILHCLGYDHETEEEKREMRAREEEIMRKMNLTRE